MPVQSEVDGLAGLLRLIVSSFQPVKHDDTEKHADQIKETLMNAMTTAALLAGFATGMALSTGADEIETHAKFVKDTFFGKDSHLCAFVRTETLPQKVGFKWSPFGLAPTPRKADDWELLPNDPELPF